jgi:N-sulfoglucosamine sulfohydrolase
VPDRQRAIRDQRFKYIRSWFPQQEQGHPLAYRDNIDMVREMRAMYLAGQLNEAQSLWFQAPGEEQLYDLQEDPFEIYNLADNPAYEADKIRLRTALDQRLAEIGDWSDESESVMVARFEREGERPVTPVPKATIANGWLTLTSTEPGSSLGYRFDEGDWNLYSGPVEVGDASLVEAKAVRYGWEESEVTSVAR